MAVTTVRLQAEVEKELEELARESRRSKSWLINEALGEYIKSRKAKEARWEETLRAMESVAQGKVISGEAVHGWLKTWGTPDEGAPPKVGQ